MYDKKYILIARSKTEKNAEFFFFEFCMKSFYNVSCFLSY